MDRNDCREEIKESVEYPSLCQQYNREDVDEVVELIADILCSSRHTVRIGGEEIPTTQAQERFQRLNYDHLPILGERRSIGNASVHNSAPPQAVGGAVSPEMRLNLRRISTF